MLYTRQDDGLAGFEYYHYDPSMAAAVLFIILFLLTTALHFYQMIRTRTWFMTAFCIGGLFELVGYIGRAASASQTSGQWTLGPYSEYRDLSLNEINANVYQSSRVCCSWSLQLSSPPQSTWSLAASFSWLKAIMLSSFDASGSPRPSSLAMSSHSSCKVVVSTQRRPGNAISH